MQRYDNFSIRASFSAINFPKSAFFNHFCAKYVIKHKKRGSSRVLPSKHLIFNTYAKALTGFFFPDLPVSSVT